MTLASVLLPERDCFTCKNQTEWGCNGPPQIPLLFPDPENPGEAVALDRCPQRAYLDNPLWYHELFGIWGWREKGQLPDPGGWRDQGAKIPKLLLLIDQAVAEGNEAKEKQEKQRQNRAARADKQAGGRRASPHVRR